MNRALDGSTRRLLSALILAASTAAVLVAPGRASANVLTVTTTSDVIAIDAVVSLREAITAANVNTGFGDTPGGSPGLDTIQFAIPGAPETVHAIQLLSALPQIIDPVVIDGYTQPGADVNHLVVNSDADLRIELEGGLAGPSTNGLWLAAPGSTIRGLVIRNFLGDGIRVDAAAPGTTIQGNFIGTDDTGEEMQANSNGVVLFSNRNLVGGPLPSHRNVISGNVNRGIVSQVQAIGNRIEGNSIGASRSGAALGNVHDGVYLVSSNENVIGGFAGNQIAYNLEAGVRLGGAASSNAILRNSIHSNVGLSIDLEPLGVTPNDPPGLHDDDNGPNGLQNFPTLGPVYSDGLTLLTVAGQLSSAVSKSYWVELFASSSCGVPGSGAARNFLGGQMVTTNGSGLASIRFQSPQAIPIGWVVAATATDSTSNTSELSACATIATLPGAPVFADGFDLGDTAAWSARVG